MNRTLVLALAAIFALTVVVAEVVAAPGPPSQCQTWLFRTSKKGSKWGKFVCKTLSCAAPGCDDNGTSKFQGFFTCRCGTSGTDLDSCNGIFARGVGGARFTCPTNACPFTTQTCEAPEGQDINEPAPGGGTLVVTACVCAEPGDPRPLPFPAPPYKD